MTGRTRQGRQRSGVYGWGPKLELAVPKSSDRRGRRGIKLPRYGTALHLRELRSACIPGKWPGTRVHRGTQTRFPRPLAANALPPSTSTSCSLVLALVVISPAARSACASSTAQAAALPPFAATQEP